MKRDDLGRFIKGEHWRDHKPFWDKEWLIKEYETKSCSEIAKEWNVTEDAIRHWLIKHDIKRRTVSEARSIKYWGCSGKDNPMFGKTGKLNPNWKGNCTQERQLFYASSEWKNVCSQVYKRDNAKCKRCGHDGKMHVHHIISFSKKKYRADINNLVLLCVKCHRFVHSRKNVNKEYIRKEDS